MAESPGAPTRARQKPPRRQALDAEGRTKYITYTRQLAAQIVQRVGQGEAWHQFCCTDGLPSYMTLYSWRKRYPEFAEALAVAREEAAERKATRALQVAEDSPPGVPGDRLRVTTLMQHAALEAPHRWGGKAAPPEPAAPVQITFYARRFERVVGPDGKAFVREIKRRGKS